jgi:hypothetical protein
MILMVCRYTTLPGRKSGSRHAGRRLWSASWQGPRPYPEGERSIDGTPKVFKKGAAILATHLKVPIYPVAMEGFFEAWPRGKGFQKFTRLQIAFGDPIYPPQSVDNPEAEYERLTAELKSRVMEMWSEAERACLMICSGSSPASSAFPTFKDLVANGRPERPAGN